MFKRKSALFIATVLTILSITGIALFPALAADKNSYTVQVKYYDALTIDYTIYYPDGSFREYGEDAPVGGLKDSNGKVIMNQVYCVDPFIPFGSHLTSSEKTTQGPLVSNNYNSIFDIRGPLLTKNYRWVPYSKDGENWGSTTTYTKDGYYFAAPWASSAAVQKNKDAVTWLILNGYRGDFRAHGDANSESQISLDRLNNMYKNTVGGYIDKSAAVMATKYALWEILTSDMSGDTVVATSTILKSVDPAWQQIFYDLSAALINDAKKGYDSDARNGSGAIPTSGITRLNLEIRNNIDPIIEPLKDDGQYIYYGPLTVEAGISNLAGEAPALEKVFLTVNDKASSVEIPSITFVSESEKEYADLNKVTLPGTARSTPYTSMRSNSSGGWGSDTFYLKIPKSLISTGAVDINKLTVNAMAMASKVPVKEGTPAVLDYQYPDGDPKAGVQDWNAIQAYVGAATQNAEIDLFAQSSLSTDKKSLGDLYIYKRIENDVPLTQEEKDQVFKFKVYYSENLPDGEPSGYPSPEAELILKSHTVHPKEKVSPDGVITLKNGEMVQIEHLPVNGYYWVAELEPEETYQPHFSIPSFSALTTIPKTKCADDGDGNYWTTPFQIDRDEDVQLAFVTYYNKVINNEVVKSKAHIQIGKMVPRPPDIPSQDEFTFKIQIMRDDWEKYPLNEDNFIIISGGSDTGGTYEGDGSDGIFKLRAFQQAIIDVEPDYSYRVIELNPGGDWLTAYSSFVLRPCGEEPCTDPNHKNGWIISGIDNAMLLTPQMREEDEQSSEGLPAAGSNSTFLYVFNNISVNNLTINKKVTGNVTKSDLTELFMFKLSCIEPIKTGDSPQLPQEPVAFTIGGGFMTVDDVLISTLPLEIWDETGELLKPEEIEDRIRTEKVMTKEGKEIDCPCIFSLKNGEKATVHELSTWNYSVSEILEAGKYTTTYSINGGESQAGRETVKFPIASDTTILFENNKPTVKQPDTPDGPKTPVTSNDTTKSRENDRINDTDKPDDSIQTDDTDSYDDSYDSSDTTGGSAGVGEQNQASNDEDTGTGIYDSNSPYGGLNPQTNDENTPFPAIVMLLIGFGCIAGAEIYRRRKRHICLKEVIHQK